MTCVDATRRVDEIFNRNISISTLAIKIPALGGGIFHAKVERCRFLAQDHGHWSKKYTH